MKSWAGEHPAKPLKRDIANASDTGFWWCMHCHRITEPKDPGDVYRSCLHCGSRRMEWKVAIVDERPLPEPTGKVNPKRLPAEKRNLSVLSRTGYWFCAECDQITERDAKCCVLCLADLPDATWIPPVPAFQEDAAS